MLDLSAVWSSHWKHVEPRYTLPNQVLCKGRYPDKICSPCVASIRWARSADQIKCFALTLSFLFTTTDQHTVHITTDAAQIHNSIYSCWLTNFKILHLGQLLVLDPECTHHSFFWVRTMASEMVGLILIQPTSYSAANGLSASHCLMKQGELHHLRKILSPPHLTCSTFHLMTEPRNSVFKNCD